MDRDFRVADLSAEKVAEINEFQKKLRNETNQNIVLIRIRTRHDKVTRSRRLGIGPERLDGDICCEEIAKNGAYHINA